MTPLGLYVHIPFCPQICPYCAFASLTGEEDQYNRYVEAVCRELQMVSATCDVRNFDTVFFGGGTPSKLAPEQLGQILAGAVQSFGLVRGVEITLEANPGTADFAKFKGFKDVGFNRLSIGVQSFADESLKMLGRVHSAAEAEKAYQVGRASGFDNINLDLIFGIPNQPWVHWLGSLDRVVELAPEHVSTYGLTLEEGTVLAERRRQGRWEPVDEESDARAFEQARARLTEAGYEHYEVSNFARPARRSRHNWACWMGAEYVGVGLSAHSFVGGVRRWNERDLPAYIEAVEQGRAPTAGWEAIDASTAFRERLWMGLRTCAGVELSLEQGMGLAGHQRFAELRKAGYVDMVGLTLRLTPKGFVLADALGVELLDLLEENALGAGRPQRDVQQGIV